jgi:hypothetical protein
VARSVRLEVGDVENPVAVGNGDSELELFVSLSLQREKTAVVRVAKLLQGKVQLCAPLTPVAPKPVPRRRRPRIYIRPVAALVAPHTRAG